jgi:hypothetical protein
MDCNLIKVLSISMPIVILIGLKIQMIRGLLLVLHSFLVHVPVVSNSSTEAKYRSFAFATAELCWLRMLFKELGLFLHAPPTFWCNNLRAIALASNPFYHARIKHIEVNYHFIHEKVVNKDVIARYLSTLDQIADVFTKRITTSRFLFLRDKLRQGQREEGSRGVI